MAWTGGAKAVPADYADVLAAVDDATTLVSNATLTINATGTETQASLLNFNHADAGFTMVVDHGDGGSSPNVASVPYFYESTAVSSNAVLFIATPGITLKHFGVLGGTAILSTYVLQMSQAATLIGMFVRVKNAGSIGIRLQGATAQAYNCIAWHDNTETSTTTGFRVDTDGATIVHCTAYGWGTEGIKTGSLSRTVKRCLSLENAGGDYSGVTGAGTDDNGGSDTSAPGTNVTDNLVDTTVFNNAAAGDFTVVDETNIDDGTTTGLGTDWPNTDIENTSRAGTTYTWGAFQVAAAGGANPHGPLGHPLHGPFGGPI